MLTTLRIKNLALVADLTLELRPGYNVITGETGAGKSVIMGALNLVLGERADRTLIRSGSDACSVEAVFDVSGVSSNLAKLLDENGLEPCEENQLVLKRNFAQTGTNRQFVNGSPTTLGVLGDIGQWLVDMHGPHDHQSLLHVSKQLDILDAFGGLQPLKQEFAGLLKRRAGLEEEKAALIVDEKTYAQQLDLLRHQVAEIKAARLQPGEEERVSQEYQRAGNASKLLELCQSSLDIISESETSMISNSGLLGRNINELVRIDAGAEVLGVLQTQLAEVLRELQSEVSHYADKIEIDPVRLLELETRLDVLHSLKRKYGGSVEAIIEFGNESAANLDKLEKHDIELERINKALIKLNDELLRKGGELSAQRRKVIPKMAKAATVELNDLGFVKCHFDIAISTLGKEEVTKGGTTISSQGLDTIEFQFSPNVGEPPRPLRSIASSGEMARVMLALKTVLAQVDEIPVLVFDEVDANVGGETALTVGQKMRQIAAQHQVLCITHLAPVAASASAHYLVSKQTKDGRTISEITQLEKKERVVEISRMLGGQSDAIRKHAEELLKKSA